MTTWSYVAAQLGIALVLAKVNDLAYISCVLNLKHSSPRQKSYIYIHRYLTCTDFMGENETLLALNIGVLVAGFFPRALEQ